MPIGSNTLDLVRMVLALEKAKDVEGVHINHLYSPGQLHWRPFDKRYGSISLDIVMTRSFGSKTGFRSFLRRQALPFKEIYVVQYPPEARKCYMLLAENVEATFVKPYKAEKERLLQYEREQYPGWYFERERK